MNNGSAVFLVIVGSYLATCIARVAIAWVRGENKLASLAAAQISAGFISGFCAFLWMSFAPASSTGVMSSGFAGFLLWMGLALVGFLVGTFASIGGVIGLLIVGFKKLDISSQARARLAGEAIYFPRQRRIDSEEWTDFARWRNRV